MDKYMLNKFIERSIVLSKLKYLYFEKKWRRHNLHNMTTAENCFDLSKVNVGRETYGSLCIKHFGNPKECIKIGNYCSIGQNCVFLLGGNHMMNYVSTYPFKTKFNINRYESVTKGKIIVDDDVWIGYDSIILSGVHIGQGAVIAAGSVVTKDVPPYAVVGGVPAKIIKYRFDEDIRKILLKIDYAKLDKNTIKENIDLLYQRIDTVRDANYIVTSLMKKIFNKKYKK